MALILISHNNRNSLNLVLTIVDPLMNEIRFRLTGIRINMQLKFRQTADALAQASVDCSFVKRREGDTVKTKKLGQ